MPLASVWERTLRCMFDEMAGETGWHRLGDSQRTRRWDDSVGRDDPKRWLTVDVIAERSGERWVLDAKYKREFGDESRADRFQMCGYAVAFDAVRVSLVYSTTRGPAATRKLLSTVVNGRPLQIESIGLPMAVGPEGCLAVLAPIVRGIAT